ncbi:MAG: metallophosphoesterase [Candidatus Limnocylindrales bacterium]
MTRYLAIEWPDPAPFRDRGGAPIRLLAISDQFDPTLGDERSRRGIGPIDVIVGCGDLDCDDLSFVADGFNAPLVYVLGNHDVDARWEACRAYCPDAVRSTSVHREAGLSIAGLTWPGRRGPGATRSERAAWNQALRLAVRRLGRREPVIVFSHVPPRGAGDIPSAGYHCGFLGYRWLLRRLRPPLWLHGHTPLAATAEWHIQRGPTTLVNVTGAVVVEIWAPGSWAASMAGPGEAASKQAKPS